MAKIDINKNKCTNCRICMNICPENCYGVENGEVVVKDPKKCILCRACEVQCPHRAINVEED